MHVFILLVTLFLAPTPEHKDVTVVTQSFVLQSQEACTTARDLGLNQMSQDKRVLDAAIACFDITGSTGKPV